MTREYLLALPKDLHIELGDKFAAAQTDTGAAYLVANVRSANTAVYAPEINFYLRCSDDDPETKMANVEKLFDIRASAFDYAQDTTFTVTVGNRVAVVSETDRTKLLEHLERLDFTPTPVSPAEVAEISGTIGAFRIHLKHHDREPATLDTDQIIWYTAPALQQRTNGIHDPDRTSQDQILNAICENYGTLELRRTKRYDHSICLFHDKRHDICGLCVEVCPTAAITKSDHDRRLLFSDINCNQCGACISICPSGAMESTVLSQRSLDKLAPFFKGKIAMVIGSGIDLETLNIRMKPGILPLIIEQEGLLHENHLLTLLQASGKPVLIITEVMSDTVSSAISLVNGIYQRIYRQQVIYPCSSEEELQQTIDQLPLLDLTTVTIDEQADTKRQLFSRRVAALVGSGSFGTISTSPHLHYGSLTIDQDSCTLCLSCADACCVGALQPHADDNSLRFNPSLCTNCGYCQLTCPEPGCLQTINDRIDLDPSFFTFQVMANDTIFHCVECGAEVGPSKSIEKITAVMKPLFAADPARLRTLSCCPDCKAKLMIAAMRS